MPNIAVTVKTTDKSVEILFNDLSQEPNLLMESAIVYKGQPVRLERNEDGVQVVLHGDSKLDLNHHIVDTVAGNIITSNDQLYNELDAIITSTIIPS